jgi:membrane-associated phospholipid phosphatase
MFALAAVVTVLLLISPRPAKAGALGAQFPAAALRVLIPAAAYVLGGVVAIAVIGLRWHYFTDTVAGAAVGIGTVCGLALILDLPGVRLPGQAASEMARAGAANTVAKATEARVAPGQDPPRED